MMQDYLEALLGAASVQSAEADAKLLSDAFGDLMKLVEADGFSVRELSGCSDSAAYIVSLVAAINARRITDKFKFGKKYLQNVLKEYVCGLFFGCSVETVFILLFDKDEKLIATEYIGEGTVNATSFLPRKLLDAAFRRGAASAIVAHNHPRGVAEPSASDVATTELIERAFCDAGVKLSCHLIVSGFDVCECKSRGSV